MRTAQPDPLAAAIVIHGPAIVKPQASSQRQREYQMKHRLVGAVIMVSVAVLVIPWLLSRQNIEANATRSTGKNAANNAIISEIVPLTAAGEAGIKITKQQSVQPALLNQDDGVGQVAKSPAPATTAGGGWAVRVGTFSKPANAASVSAKLAKSGFTAHKVTVKTDLGHATRIWLGPYAKKETAGEVGKRLKILIGEQGFVTEHAP